MHLTDEPGSPAAAQTDFATFREIDIRIGTIIEAAPLDGARKPAWRLVIDFGPGVGLKKSSAQVTEHYSPDALIGKQAAAVVNFPPRQIGKFMSEVLTLGFPDADNSIVLFSPDFPVPNGARLA
ncbi:MAG: tRNA-binding protein [Hyphomonas sp. BRH_c22]|uniref:tRNA-binding protein n=1 Tax=Hyphomonas sp. BRH_c22 TaxID=1629710 RepID=UPI0005F20BB2|nr:tRNA-binding protein [Hyphomonas sp. BRH_c22]KJS35621.1 MAG: tRNA-binding protein [Hyphomonas sp. BRH_c22]KJS39223.1 MAG: tRNA-binding protein [Hyphomonas sp. BRH_c22]